MPSRFAPGLTVGSFTLIAVHERRRLTTGTLVVWRVRCNPCGQENYIIRGPDLRRNKSCGCIPKPGFRGRHTEESKAKNAAAHVGVRAGPKHPRWKGAAAGYQAVHRYARYNFEECACEHCGTTDAKREWAMVHGHEMSRDRVDWLRLCRSCHWKYDKTADGRTRNSEGRFV